MRILSAEPLAGLPWFNTGPSDKESIARQAVEVLMRRCPRILQAIPDIVRFEAEYRRLNYFDSRYRAGFRVLIEGGPVLANQRARVMPNPQFIPGDHTLVDSPARCGRWSRGQGNGSLAMQGAAPGTRRHHLRACPGVCIYRSMRFSQTLHSTA